MTDEHVIETFARGEQAALRQGMAELCRLEGLSDWSDHADRYEVTQAESPV